MLRVLRLNHRQANSGVCTGGVVGELRAVLLTRGGPVVYPAINFEVAAAIGSDASDIRCLAEPSEPKSRLA